MDVRRGGGFGDSIALRCQGFGFTVASPVGLGFRRNDDAAVKFDFARALALSLQVKVFALGDCIAFAKTRSSVSLAGFAVLAELLELRPTLEFALALVRLALLLTLAGRHGWLPAKTA
jgi:hypothetical protein